MRVQSITFWYKENKQKQIISTSFYGRYENVLISLNYLTVMKENNMHIIRIMYLLFVKLLFYTNLTLSNIDILSTKILLPVWNRWILSSCARKENRECLILFIVSYRQYLFVLRNLWPRYKNVVVRCLYDHEKLL